MGTKNNPGKFDCYHKAEPDEPIFVLLGRDPSAAGLVMQWADQRERDIALGFRPASDREKVAEARECAKDMLDYAPRFPIGRAPALPDPPSNFDPPAGVPTPEPGGV